MPLRIRRADRGPREDPRNARAHMSSGVPACTGARAYRLSPPYAYIAPRSVAFAANMSQSRCHRTGRYIWYANVAGPIIRFILRSNDRSPLPRYESCMILGVHVCTIYFPFLVRVRFACTRAHQLLDVASRSILPPVASWRGHSSMALFYFPISATRGSLLGRSNQG